MTIDSQKIIYDLIENDGHYSDDPQVYQIFRYTNDWGNTTYAIFYHERHDIYNSPFVHNPTLLWQRGAGLTIDGEQFMEATNGNTGSNDRVD